MLANILIQIITISTCDDFANSRVWQFVEGYTINTTIDFKQTSKNQVTKNFDLTVVNAIQFSKRLNNPCAYSIFELGENATIQNLHLVINATINLEHLKQNQCQFITIAPFDAVNGNMSNVSISGTLHILNFNNSIKSKIIISNYLGSVNESTYNDSKILLNDIFSELQIKLNNEPLTNIANLSSINQTYGQCQLSYVSYFNQVFGKNLQINILPLIQTLDDKLLDNKIYQHEIEYTLNRSIKQLLYIYTGIQNISSNIFKNYYVDLFYKYAEFSDLLQQNYESLTFDNALAIVELGMPDSQYTSKVIFTYDKIILFSQNNIIECDDDQLLDVTTHNCISRSFCGGTIYKQTCQKDCKSGQMLYTEVKDYCVFECPYWKGYYDVAGVCTLGFGNVSINGNNVRDCLPQQYLFGTGCYDNCPSYTIANGFKCTTPKKQEDCESQFYVDDTVNYPYKYKYCTNSCSFYVINDLYVCSQKCSTLVHYNQSCLAATPENCGAIYIEDQLQIPTKCRMNCLSNFAQNNICVRQCDVPFYQTTFSTCQTCQTLEYDGGTIFDRDSKNCVQQCQFLNRTQSICEKVGSQHCKYVINDSTQQICLNNCVINGEQYYFELMSNYSLCRKSCSGSLPYISADNTTCVANCQQGSKQQPYGKQCMECPHYIFNYTCIDACPEGFLYLDAATQVTCVDHCYSQVIQHIDDKYYCEACPEGKVKFYKPGYVEQYLCDTPDKCDLGKMHQLNDVCTTIICKDSKDLCVNKSETYCIYYNLIYQIDGFCIDTCEKLVDSNGGCSDKCPGQSSYITYNLQNNTKFCSNCNSTNFVVVVDNDKNHQCSNCYDPGFYVHSDKICNQTYCLIEDNNIYQEIITKQTYCSSQCQSKNYYIENNEKICQTDICKHYFQLNLTNQHNLCLANCKQSPNNHKYSVKQQCVDVCPLIYYDPLTNICYEKLDFSDYTLQITVTDIYKLLVNHSFVNITDQDGVQIAYNFTDVNGQLNVTFPIINQRIQFGYLINIMINDTENFVILQNKEIFILKDQHVVDVKFIIKYYYDKYLVTVAVKDFDTNAPLKNKQIQFLSDNGVVQKRETDVNGIILFSVFDMYIIGNKNSLLFKSDTKHKGKLLNISIDKQVMEIEFKIIQFKELNFVFSVFNVLTDLPIQNIRVQLYCQDGRLLTTLGTNQNGDVSFKQDEKLSIYEIDSIMTIKLSDPKNNFLDITENVLIQNVNFYQHMYMGNKQVTVSVLNQNQQNIGANISITLYYSNQTINTVKVTDRNGQFYINENSMIINQGILFKYGGNDDIKPINGFEQLVIDVNKSIAEIIFTNYYHINLELYFYDGVQENKLADSLLIQISNTKMELLIKQQTDQNGDIILKVSEKQNLLLLNNIYYVQVLDPMNRYSQELIYLNITELNIYKEYAIGLYKVCAIVTYNQEIRVPQINVSIYVNNSNIETQIESDFLGQACYFYRQDKYSQTDAVTLQSDQTEDFKARYNVHTDVNLIYNFAHVNIFKWLIYEVDIQLVDESQLPIYNVSCMLLYDGNPVIQGNTDNEGFLQLISSEYQNFSFIIQRKYDLHINDSSGKYENKTVPLLIKEIATRVNAQLNPNPAILRLMITQISFGAFSLLAIISFTVIVAYSVKKIKIQNEDELDFTEFTEKQQFLYDTLYQLKQIIRFTNIDTNENDDDIDTIRRFTNKIDDYALLNNLNFKLNLESEQNSTRLEPKPQRNSPMTERSGDKKLTNMGTLDLINMVDPVSSNTTTPKQPVVKKPNKQQKSVKPILKSIRPDSCNKTEISLKSECETQLSSSSNTQGRRVKLSKNTLEKKLKASSSYIQNINKFQLKTIIENKDEQTKQDLTSYKQQLQKKQQEEQLKQRLEEEQKQQQLQKTRQEEEQSLKLQLEEKHKKDEEFKKLILQKFENSEQKQQKQKTNEKQLAGDQIKLKNVKMKSKKDQIKKTIKLNPLQMSLKQFKNQKEEVLELSQDEVWI